jgi:signal transduction histidine kinase
MSEDEAGVPQKLNRLAALQRLALQAPAIAAAAEGLTGLAAKLLHTPIAWIVLAQAAGPAVLSSVGLTKRSNISEALLYYARILPSVQPQAPLLIGDLRSSVESRHLADDPQLGIVAYAAASLIAADGATFGALCVADRVARAWTAEDSANLLELAALAMQNIETHYDLLVREESAAAAQRTQAELEQRLQEDEAQLADARQRLAAELTQRKALAYALVEMQKRESLGVLAAGIAHNFNNLLSTILGNAEMALLELEPDSPAQASIAPITIAAQRATALTRQMLMYAGQGNFLMHPLDINAIVADVSELLGASVARRVTLNADLMPAVPLVVADATQIRQAITNLVTNAVEALGDAGGIIQITTGVQELDQATLSTVYHAAELPAGTYVTLAVSDNGCGMDATTSSRIFDPFFTTKFTGRGLGLAAVLGIVRGLRGAIGVESTPGQGTTIRMIFPAIADNDHTPIE